MKVSIVIPTFNRRDTLAVTLPTMLRQQGAPDEFEIVIVSDGSTDGTREFVEALTQHGPIRFIDAPNRGASATRNAGVDAASGDLVLFLDDDFMCPPGLVAAHVEAQERWGPAAVSGRIDVDAGSRKNLLGLGTQLWYEGYYASATPGPQRGLREGVWLISNTSIPRDVFRACGGFDDEVPWPREDVELGLRLLEHGVELVYAPDAKAAEKLDAPTGRHYARAGAAAGRADVVLTRKHPHFRPESLLTPIGNGVFKRSLRAALIRSPFAQPVLRGLVRAADLFCAFAPVRRFGLRLAGLSYHVAIHRSAARELGSWKRYDESYGRAVSTLLYHRIGPSEPRTHPALTVAPSHFEAQMDWLARHGYTGISAGQWLDWCMRGEPLPAKPVIITFDDGYGDLAAHAFPVLERHRFGATVYVVVDRIGRQYDWDDGVEGTHPLLNLDQLRHWNERGIEIGAHTRVHARLTGVPEGRLDDEVAGGLEALHAVAPVRTFAYPYGSFDERVVSAVREHFELAFTVEERLSHLGSDRFRLGRTTVQPGRSLLEFGLQVRLGWNPVERLRLRKAALLRKAS